MKEAFTKIKEAIANIHRVVKTDEDLEWNRAIYKCSTIVSEVEAEYGNGKTNADRIRAMSDEEMAAFLAETELHGSQGSYKDYLDWLKSPTND